MFQEKRKQGLAFWIECPRGVGREPGLVQIKLMLLMDLVLVEMGAAAVSAAAEPVGGGRGFLEVELTDAESLCLEGTPDCPFPEEQGPSHLAGSQDPFPPTPPLLSPG